MTDDKIIMLAIPCLNTVNIRFVASLISMIMFPHDGMELRLQFVTDSMTYTARNTLAEMAIKQECDYVLWIDSDMTFAPDVLDRLMQSMDDDKEMVTGLYYKRRGDHGPVIYKNTSETYYDHPKDTIFHVDGCGFGMVLIRTDILRRVINANDGLLFHPDPDLGEDLSFCRRFRQTGGVIWCDPSIVCGHIGEYEYTGKDCVYDTRRNA